jgi:outer membrane protein assembly factor BamB
MTAPNRSRRAVLATASLSAVAGCIIQGSESGPGTESDGTVVDCDRTAVWPQFQRTATHEGGLQTHEPLGETPSLTEVTTNIASETGPVIDAQHCYINDGNRLLAIDRQTGEQQWEQSFGTVSSGSPVVACGLVFVQTGSTTLAMDATDGTLRWKKPYGHGVPGPNLLVDDRTLYLGYYDEIKSFSLTGEQQWSTSRDENFTGLALSGSTLVACSAGVDRPGTVQAFDRDTGEHLWKRSGIKPQTPPATDDDTAYLTDKRGAVHALDVASGDIQWERGLEGHSTYATPAVDTDRGQVYLPTGSTGSVVALDSASGKERWQTDVGTFARLEVTHARDQVYVLANSLYALESTGGDILWRLDDPVQNGPMALTEDALWLHTGGSLTRAVTD